MGVPPARHVALGSNPAVFGKLLNRVCDNINDVLCANVEGYVSVHFSRFHTKFAGSKINELALVLADNLSSPLTIGSFNVLNYCLAIRH